jgi:hypothetical protein
MQWYRFVKQLQSVGYGIASNTNFLSFSWPWVALYSKQNVGPSLPNNSNLVFQSYYFTLNFLYMPMGNLATYVCQKLQADLIDFYKQNAAQYRTLGDTSFLKWLLSPQNTAGFRKIEVESIPGKKRGVAFAVDTAYCLSLCGLNVACDAANIQYVDPATQEIVFDLTNAPWRHCDSQGRPVKLRFTEEDLMKYCTREDTGWIKNQILRYLFEFEEALDKAISTALNGEIGTNASGAAITNIPLFVQSTQFAPPISVLNAEAQWYINQVFSDIGLDGNYALIGGTITSKIAQFMKWVGLNEAGVDMSKAPNNQPYLFYNRNFNAIYGQSDMIMMSPGAAQLVTWNRYKGEKRRQVTDLYTKATVTLPRTGLEVDFKFFYDYSCEIWVYEAFLHAELATVPPGGCSDALNGIDVSGVNGIVRIHDCGSVPLIPPCPETVSS